MTKMGDRKSRWIIPLRDLIFQWFKIYVDIFYFHIYGLRWPMINDHVVAKMSVGHDLWDLIWSHPPADTCAGYIQLFGGNMDIKTERRHYLNVPMVARYVRIHPLTWRRQIGLRVGILGKNFPLFYPNSNIIDEG